MERKAYKVVAAAVKGLERIYVLSQRRKNLHRGPICNCWRVGRTLGRCGTLETKEEKWPAASHAAERAGETRANVTFGPS